MNPMLCKTLLPLSLFVASLPLQLNAQLYWDTNGATAGAGEVANGTWGGTNANWSTSPDGDEPTDVYVPGSPVVFAAGSDLVSAVITLSGNQSASSLTFTQGTVSISGGTITGMAAITVADGTTATMGAGTYTAGHMLTVNGSGTFTGSTFSGGSTMVKEGTGTATLSSLDATLTVNAGTMIITGGNKLKGATINSGATLRLTGNVIDGTRAVTLNTGGALELGAGVIDGMGTLSGGGALSGEAGSDLSITGGTFSGTISGDLDITKSGTGTHTFSGTNTSIGNITVSAGTYTLTDTGSITFTIGADGVNNAILGTGIANLNGTFSFDLSGAEAVGGNSWLIVDVDNLAESFGSTFMVADFEETVEDSGIWILGGYTFDKSTGTLSYTVIPEPSSFALLGGLGALLAAATRRRGRAAQG